MSRFEDQSIRIRILALCGAKSNSEITKLQLENLHITEEKYDIFYLNGLIEADDPAPEMVGIVRGPFFSWLDVSGEGGNLNESILRSISLVIRVVEDHGPFDGIYGFSHGGFIASLAAGIADDDILQETHKSFLAAGFEDDDKLQETLTTFSLEVKKNNPSRRLTSYVSSRRLTSNASSRRLTSNASSRRLTSNVSSRTLTRNGHLMIESPPFKFVIVVCGAIEKRILASVNCSVHGSAHNYADLHPEPDEDGFGNIIKVRSIHIIGIEDSHKTQSEEIACRFAKPHVIYHPGGHSVGREMKSDSHLISTISEFIKSRGNPVLLPRSTKAQELSEVSSITVQHNYQSVLVQLKQDLLLEGLHGGTIIGCLDAQPSFAPFLNNARDSDASNTTTYGDVKRFLVGGAGDLRHLGVKQGEVVAYGAPPGGSAAAALAFLSIGAQTTAAPLAPGMTEPEVTDSLGQFHAKHLILFEGIENPGIESAFKKWAEEGKGVLHHAKIAGTPGFFQYVDPKVSDIEDELPLINPKDGTCLLLRTSGTTALPKVVPLKHESLITNGAIIAKSMQLTNKDVCYSVMPLFHIGGISASILCTLASGGQVCCDGEPFEPSRMVDAMALSNPQPTWYSSVPTIHNATVAFMRDNANIDPKLRKYGIDEKGIWSKGHSLRQIRSGAAALLGPDGQALGKAYGGVPIYPTYSMSEQMPISQPPVGKGDTIVTHPGSVGCPVAASVSIVSRSHYRLQPFGEEGEIAISGNMIMKSYLENPDADAKTYFYLTDGNDVSMESCKYFLTGDVGVIDRDGFLYLKGRAKELIKKGGEQVSPYEVEEALLDHPWVQTPVCFSVPSRVYGEEVGCAIILSPEAPTLVEDSIVIKQMRKWMKEKQLTPAKWPTKWMIATDDQLPKTKTKKYIRVGLAEKLGFAEGNMACELPKETKARIDWGVITGFRFFLACYVMFMHIGDNKSWGAFNNLRGFPWHVHVFYTLGGFSMASPMNPYIKNKFSYFLSRIGNMYPMYMMALIFGLANLLVVCRPSTFNSNFHWDAQPDDLYQPDGSLSPLFCEGTPLTKSSYWGSLFLTVIVYIFGLAVTPFWPGNWWMGYYLWFSSMYYQCLALYPVVYNYFIEKFRKKTRLLLVWSIGLQFLNAFILATAWFSMRNGQGYNHYDVETGETNDPSDYTNGVTSNVVVLSFYLFGPFWALYFIMGVILAFLYDAYRPAEKHNARMWGLVADNITLVMIGLSVACICQGVQNYGEFPDPKYLRPDAGNQYTDNPSLSRLWDNICGRIMAPVTTLWIFALSTGEGFTANILRGSFLVDTLGPNSYNCFLFHQMIGQWYFAATRQGHWWNWWRYRKSFYWFSPSPCPVEWYEYFYVVGIVVVFSRFMDRTFTPKVKHLFGCIRALFIAEEEADEIDIAGTLCTIIEKMTGIEPDMESTLEECGLASVGVPIIVGMLNDNFSKKKQPLGVTTHDLVQAKTIEDIAEVVCEALERMLDAGV